MQSTKRFIDFEQWFSELQTLANIHGEQVFDREAWGEEYENGKTPDGAFFDEYPEHRPSDCPTQHSEPCSQCPWRRASAPGWLGASQPGEFLAQSDSQLRMPCHSAVDSEDPAWQEKAANAPQCAGRAIFQANRAQSPAEGLLRLPANRELVFARPHEFVAHHTRQAPEALANVMVYDLYDVKKS